MAIQLQFRRGTAYQWSSANTILAAGEIGYEIDTRYFKIGDGTTAWANLSYSTSSTATSANNAAYLGGVAAASYQLSSTLSANVATLTANNVSFVGTVSAANVVSNSQLSSNLANYQTTAGLDANVAVRGFQTTAGLSANVAKLTANSTNFVGTVSAANVVSNAELTANLANYALVANGLFTGQVNAVSLNIGTSFVANALGTYIQSNTINVGTNVNSANGYTYLPNGFKLNWGWVSANSSSGNVTFRSAYSINVYSVIVTSNTAEATYQAAVIGTNNTVAVVRTANDVSTNVFWQAIGY